MKHLSKEFILFKPIYDIESSALSFLVKVDTTRVAVR